MEREESIEEWARAATFSRPVRWGELEAEILAREPPTGVKIPVWAWLLVAAAAVGLGVLALLLFGSAIAGLLMLVIGRSTDGTSGANKLLEFAPVAFLGAMVIQLVLFRMWWETKRRSGTVVVMSGIVVIASVPALVVVLSNADDLVNWLSVVLLVTVVAGIATIGLSLVSRPEGRANKRMPPRRGPRRSSQRARYMKAREQVLQVLHDRGLVGLDDNDRIRMLEMPLGYWSELDDVDEAEWRRILELRHVGWRDFDASDKRTS